MIISRNDFEEWADDMACDLRPSTKPGRRYRDHGTELAWLAWQKRSGFAPPKSKDVDRLDWLERQGLIGIGHVYGGTFKWFAGSVDFPDLRSVCDAAMNVRGSTSC